MKKRGLNIRTAVIERAAWQLEHRKSQAAGVEVVPGDLRFRSSLLNMGFWLSAVQYCSALATTGC